MSSSEPRDHGVRAGSNASDRVPFILDELGWAGGVRRRVSPHRDERPAACAVELIVIHNISLPPGEFGGDAIGSLFLGRLDCSAHPFFGQLIGLRVSSHFLIHRTGEVDQFVPCNERAWHAGLSQWRGRARCNDFSVGIELEGTDVMPYTDAQYDSLIALTDELRARYPIIDVVGHSDIAPGRKTDPGAVFDWPRLRRATNS